MSPKSGRRIHWALALMAAVAMMPRLQAAETQPVVEDEAHFLNLMRSNEPNRHMVAVEALVVEVNEERTRDLGLQYGYHQRDFSNGTVTNGSGVISGVDVRLGRMLSPVRVPVLIRNPQGVTGITQQLRNPGFNIGLSGIEVGGGAISMRLRTLLDSGDASIQTRPVAIALNNTPVRIESGTDVPYLDARASNKLSVAIEKVGVLMEVTPQIVRLKPGEIRLKIDKLEVSSVSSFITQENIDRPVFSRSETRTEVTLNNGETFVVGNLKTRRKLHVEDRIPLLGRIPGLGWLFKSQEDMERNVDVLFFITPHILAPGQNFQPTFEFKNIGGLGLEVADRQ